MIRRLDPGVPDAQTTLYGWSTAEFREAASATIFGVPIAGDHGTTAVVVIGVALWATLAYLNSYARLDLAVGPAQVSAQRSGLYLAPLLVLLAASFVPVGVMLYSLTQFLLALAINVAVQRRYPAQVRVAGPGVAFGLPFVITLGAVAMAVTPVLGGWWAMGGCVVAAGAVLVLREWLPTRTGGVGPLRARRFLADAVHFGILTHDDGLYRFRDPAWLTALAGGDGATR